MGKTAGYDQVIETIAGNYEEIEHSIANQLLLNVPNHPPTVGSYRENVWKSLFEMVIPRKYCIEQGVFIIDAYGHKSREVDLAIFDELYTPYIFNYGKIKFIPIEAVAAVVQCKSQSLTPEDIREWVQTIDQLVTSMDSVARMAANMVDNSETVTEDSGRKTTQTATRPVKILCTITGEKKISAMEDIFDIILKVDKDTKKLIKSIPKEKQSLGAWNESLNHAIEGIEESEDRQQREWKKSRFQEGRTALLSELKVSQGSEEEENVILSLIFQLNQLLMVINNPMLFPHRAYAKRFSQILEEAKKANSSGKTKEKKDEPSE